MKTRLLFIFCFVVIVVKSQTNIDFETGDLTGWEGETGCAPNAAAHPYYLGIPPYLPSDSNCKGGWVPGLVKGRHTLIKDSLSGTAMCTPVQFKTAQTGAYVLKLGDTAIYAHSERISNKYLVTQSNAYLTIKFALFLQDGANLHTTQDAPFFSIDFFDKNKDPIACLSKKYSYQDPGTSLYKQVSGYYGTFPCWEVLYMDWQTLQFDLSGHINDSITVRFTTADCSVGGDWCYALIDCSVAAVAEQKELICPGEKLSTGYDNTIWQPGNIKGRSLTINNSGKYQAYYYVYDSACTFVNFYDVTLKMAPTVTLACEPIVCTNENAHQLTGGSPVGGIYSGPAVNSNTGTIDATQLALYDSILIKYTYLDQLFGCSSSDSCLLNVESCVTGIQTQPNVSAHAYKSFALNVNDCDQINYYLSLVSKSSNFRIFDLNGKLLVQTNALTMDQIRSLGASIYLIYSNSKNEAHRLLLFE